MIKIIQVIFFDLHHLDNEIGVAELPHKHRKETHLKKNKKRSIFPGFFLSRLSPSSFQSALFQRDAGMH